MSRSAVFIWLYVVLAITAFGAGCAKNVERVEFEKWGNSFVPRGSSVDTTVQGGAASESGTLPKNGTHIVPKASVGGTYMRGFASSPSYRMVGGFHVTPNQ